MSKTIFSKNLRKLREEKQISQKSAASSLGISQALLSHYEKGIRECGLDFLSRVSKFYEVSTDFMLGISETRQIKRDNIIFNNKIKDSEFRKNGKDYNIYSVLYKNLLTNAITYIFDNLREEEYKETAVNAGKYISLSIYCLYNILNNTNKKNPFENYNFENQYLNIIINGVDIKI